MANSEYLVRYGNAGNIGRFASNAGCFDRSARVVVRSSIGIQLGTVLAPTTSESLPRAGSIVRPASPQDELLAARLSQRRDEAIAACRARLAEAGVEATLVDAEYTLDARSLCFYFLSDPPPGTDAILEELGNTYAEAIGLEAFATLLEEGCGPDCGTEKAAGCAGGCATCVVARVCHAPAG